MSGAAFINLSHNLLITAGFVPGLPMAKSLQMTGVHGYYKKGTRITTPGLILTLDGKNTSIKTSSTLL